MRAILVVWAATGCIDPGLTPCGDLLCPSATVCVADTVCLPPDEASACDGHADGDACTTTRVTAGVCSGYVCVPPGCGNRIVELGEVCDDGNRLDNDGCSSDCVSNETCGNGVVDVAEECDDGNFVSGDTCSSTCRRETLAWTTIDRPGMPENAYTALAYDAAHQRIVMVGGALVTSTEPTWLFDGTSWTKGPSVVPARRRAAMAYDPIRQRVVLFGGGNDNGWFTNNETWELDGTTWTKLAPPTSPPARAGHSMTWDPVRQRIVLFGGATGLTNYGDTWTFDGTTWAPLTLTASPAPRSRAGLAFDEQRQQVVLVGGFGALGLATYREVWVLEATRWTLLSTTAPDYNTGLLAYDSSRHTLVLRGSYDSWEGDGVTWTRRTDTPAGYPSGAIVYDAGRSRVVYWTEGHHHELTTSWTTLPETPRPDLDRGGRNVVFDAARQRLIVRGRTINYSGGPSLLETWARTTDNRWTLIAPPTMAQPGLNTPLVYDPEHRRIVGFDDTTTWILDGDTWQPFATATTPPSRSAAALAYDLDQHRVVMFGGDGPGVDDALNDTWVFDGIDWTEVIVSARPDGRYNATLAYDAAHKRIVLAGGTQSVNAFRDVWALGNGTWVELPSLPAARWDGTLLYNPVTRAVDLVGGSEISGGGGNVVEFDGTDWTYLSADHPLWVGSNTAYDPFLHAVIAFGVRGTEDDDAIGLLTSVPGNAAESCSGSDDIDGDGLRGCADPDCFAFCDPLCPPATSCATNRPRCGDLACDPTFETTARCPGDCP